LGIFQSLKAPHGRHLSFKRLFVSKHDDYGTVDTKICAAYGVEKYFFLECIKGGNK